MFEKFEKIVNNFLVEHPAIIIHDMKMSNFGVNHSDGRSVYYGVILLQYDEPMST